MSSIIRRRKMADTSRDGLLLGGGICHVTATSQYTHGSKKKFLLAYVILFKHVNFGNNISSACAKEYLIAATY